MTLALPATFNLPADRPALMGIVNVTPDSFSDGGQFFAPDAAIAHAKKLIDDGADILDIGGESTRPGALPAAVEDELSRVMPVIKALRQTHPHIPLSIDTQKSAVMAAAINAGVAMVNDVNALRASGAIEVCAQSDVAVCLMHMQDEPRTMQSAPQYQDVFAEVMHFLHARAHACVLAGMAKSRICIDPGIGFGKTLTHNLALLNEIATMATSGYPVLIGVSRKSLFKQLLGLDVEQRLLPSVVAAIHAAEQGAAILRVHDVRETRDALALWRAMNH